MITLEQMVAAGGAGSGAEAAQVVPSDDHLCRRGARWALVAVFACWLSSMSAIVCNQLLAVDGPSARAAARTVEAMSGSVGSAVTLRNVKVTTSDPPWRGPALEINGVRSGRGRAKRIVVTVRGSRVLNKQ